MRHASHQVFVYAGALRFGAGACRCVRVAKDGGAGEGGVDDLHRVVDGRFGAGAVEAFADEAGGIDVGIGGDDDYIGAGDVFGGEHVIRADAALRFDFDFMAKHLRAFFQRFLRHVGVGDAGRAGGDADDEFAGSGGLRCSALAPGNVRQGAADVFGVGGFRQAFRNFLVADDGTQALQNRQVFVVAGGNADDEVGGLAFAVFPINAARHLQHGDGGFFDEVAALRCAVRNGDAVAEVGVFLRFAREHAFDVFRRDFAVLGEQRRDLADGLVFVARRRAKADEGGGQLYGFSFGWG